MRTSMLIAAFALSLAACATETTYEGTTLPGPTVAKTMCRTGCSGLEGVIDSRDWVPLGDGVFQSGPSSDASATALQAVPDLCSQLPESGPCALACDPAAFGSTLPVNTCGAAMCSVGGGQLLVSGCNTAD